jgi:hypothetical protein
MTAVKDQLIRSLPQPFIKRFSLTLILGVIILLVAQKYPTLQDLLLFVVFLIIIFGLGFDPRLYFTLGLIGLIATPFLSLLISLISVDALSHFVVGTFFFFSAGLLKQLYDTIRLHRR